MRNLVFPLPSALCYDFGIFWQYFIDKLDWINNLV